jgi:allantoin racemase
MKILILEPGAFTPEDMAMKEEYAKTLCSEGTSLKLVLIEPAFVPPPDFSSFSLYIPGILQEIKKTEKEKFDAVIIDCFTDTGLEPAKIAAHIPVVAPGEASMHFACLLADKFGMITPMAEGIPFHNRQVNNYGLAEHLVSIKPLNMEFAGLRQKKAELERKVTQLSREMVAEGAQAVVVGCTVTFPALGVGSAAKISKKLGIVLIDPLAIAMRTAEMMVHLNLIQSNLAFPKTAQAF